MIVQLARGGEMNWIYNQFQLLEAAKGENIKMGRAAKETFRAAEIAQDWNRVLPNLILSYLGLWVWKIWLPVKSQPPQSDRHV